MMTPNEQISIFLEIIADYRNANADLRQKKKELEERLDAAKYCEDMPDYESIIIKLKEELNMVSNSNNEMLDQLTIARQDNKNLKESNDQLMLALDMRMTECDELKGKNFILEDLIKKGEEHYRDKYCCDAFEEMEDIIEDLKNDNKKLQYDCDNLTFENDSLKDEIKMLIAEKNGLVQKLQNINDEYLILHNEKTALEKNRRKLDVDFNFTAGE